MDKRGSAVIDFNTKDRGKYVRVCGAKRWAQASGIIDTCACRNMLLVFTSMDLLKTFGAEDMGWNLRGSRIGCSAATIKEILVESREKDVMVFVVKGFVQERYNVFWCFVSPQIVSFSIYFGIFCL